MFNWTETRSGVSNCTSFKIDAYLDRDSLIAVVFEEVVVMRFELILNRLSNGRNERGRVQIEIIAENLGEDLRRDQLFYEQEGQCNRQSLGSLSLTIFVPGERIAQFLPFDFHVQSNGHQIFRLLRIVDGRRRVRVIETSGEERNTRVSLHETTGCSKP